MAGIYFVIDARTPWQRVASVATLVARAGFTKEALVFAGPSPVPPPRTWVDDKLDAILKAHASEPGNPATHTSDVVKSCPAMIEAFDHVGASGSGDIAKALVEATGPALLACNCSLDVPALRSLMWRLFANLHPTVTLDVTLTDDAPPLALPAATTWRDASAKLTPGSKLWVEVAGAH